MYDNKSPHARRHWMSSNLYKDGYKTAATCRRRKDTFQQNYVFGIAAAGEDDDNDDEPFPLPHIIAYIVFVS